jgi:hypothetical protein
MQIDESLLAERVVQLEEAGNWSSHFVSSHASRR